DTDAPVVPRFIYHPCDQVDVHLIEAKILDPFIRAVDLCRMVGAPVHFKNLVIKVLDAETQSRYSHFLECFELVLLKRSRLALKSHLLGVIPGNVLVKAISETLELQGAQVRRGAAAKIHVLKRPASYNRQPAIKLNLFDQGFDIRLDIASILIRVNAEVA